MSRSLLVVDDVPEILEFFDRVAQRYRARPLEVVTMADPAAALALLQTRAFDVVISDFRMPRVNGVEILAAARRAKPDGRRVLMTGYNEIPVTNEDLAAADPQARIRKPLRAAFLLEFLHACLSDDPHALDGLVQPEAET